MGGNFFGVVLFVDPLTLEAAVSAAAAWVALGVTEVVVADVPS